MTFRTVAAYALISILILVGYAGLMLFLPVDVPDSKEVNLYKGMSFRDAASALEADGVIRSKLVFLVLGRVTKLHTKMRYGYYIFQGKLSTWDVFNHILSGRIVQRTVTVIEGDSYLEVREKLSDAKIMNSAEFDGLFRNAAFISALDIDAPSLEGYLYPDTYFIPKGTSPEEVIVMMVDRLRHELKAIDLDGRKDKLKMNLHEVLTLASIIEKEAMVDDERPLVSAVYHNRLRKRQPLQADPTAIYGIKPYSSGVNKDDIRRRTLYNTYRITGLPPGPIASAGIKSIHAALYPADVPYLFFVSQNNGTHKFTKTYSEHLKAVDIYREKKEEQRRSDEDKETKNP